MICCKQRSGSFLILTLLSPDNSILSILEGFFYTDEKVLVVTNLFTSEEHRFKGYATKLLKRAIWEARRNKIDRLKLDDCTDAGNYFYVNRGFQYEIPGSPEMWLNLEYIPK